MKIDKKDQQALGEEILKTKKENPSWTMAEAADAVFECEFKWLPNAPNDFKHDYKTDYLLHLADQGDKYSLEMKSAIEKGEKLEEDPSGN